MEKTNKKQLKSLEARLYTIQSKIALCYDLSSIQMELNQANDFIEKARQEVIDKINTP